MVVGPLAAPVGTLDRPDQRRLRAARHAGLAARNQRRPKRRALPGARALAFPVLPEQVERVSARLTRTRPRPVFAVETTVWPARAAWPVGVCSRKMPAASVARAAAAIGHRGLSATLER